MRGKQAKRLQPHLIRDIRERIEKDPEEIVEFEEFDAPRRPHPRRRWIDWDDDAPRRGRRSAEEPASIRETLWEPKTRWPDPYMFDETGKPRRKGDPPRFRTQPYGGPQAGKFGPDPLPEEWISPRGASTRRAEYDPTLTLPEPDNGRQLGIGFNLPRRMRADLWEERDGDVLKTADLMRLADEFWYGYRKKRWSYMPERGDRMNMPLDVYAQVFRRDLELTVAEVQNLIDFMYVTRLVPEWEAQMIADNFQLGYTYAWDRVDV
jgi:hypothetical protein